MLSLEEKKSRQREACHRWRMKNKFRIKELFSIYWKKQRDLVYDHYGRVCKCCGETEQKFLSIDHINNDGAKQRDKAFGKRINGRYHNGSMYYYHIVKNGFPTDLQILCMNCNFGKMRNKGVCPHGKV